jgi:hypothetical protein
MGDRVAIVGARKHPNLDFVRAYVRGLPGDVTVVSGGADGVDIAATIEAREAGLSTLEYVPMKDGTIWVVKSYAGSPPVRSAQIALPPGTSMRDALIFRNTWIVVVCNRGVSFPDGTRGGTIDAETQAKRFRRPWKAIRMKDGGGDE